MNRELHTVNHPSRLAALVLIVAFAAPGCSATCDDACASLISCATSRQEGYGPLLSGNQQNTCVRECKKSISAGTLKPEELDCLDQASGDCKEVATCSQ